MPGEVEENSWEELYEEHARATFSKVFDEELDATIFVCIDYAHLSWARDGNSFKFIMVDIEGNKACWTVWPDVDGKRKALSYIEEAIKPLANATRTWGLFALKVASPQGKIIKPSPGANASYSLGARYVYNPTRVPGQLYAPTRIDLREEYCKYFISRAGDPSRWVERSEDFMPAVAVSPKGISMALFRSPAKPSKK